MTTVHAEHYLGALADIPVGEGRAFTCEGMQVAVFHLRSGVVRATSAVCPHAGGPLADGQLDGQVVMCPLHAHVFELASGHCRTGAASVATFPVRVVDGEILLRLQ